MKKNLLRFAFAILIFVVWFLSRAAVPHGPNAPGSAPPRLDAWRILGPGGGGAQFYPAISPHDPNLVLVACDMTGAYISEDAGRSWRMFNLRSPVKFFAFDPLDSQVIYAGTDILWRSGDRGRTWKLVYPSAAGIRLIMPDDHASPEAITPEGPAGRILALAVDPADSQKLYAAIRESGKAGLFQSSDRGATWRRTADLPGGGRRIYVDANSPPSDRTLYVLGENSVAVRKAGQWKQGPAPEGVGEAIDMSAGFAATGQLVVYMVTGGGWRSDSARGVFVSPDGGATWKALDMVLLRNDQPGPAVAELTCVATSPMHCRTPFQTLRLSSSAQPG